MNIEEFVNYYLQNYRHEVLLNPYNGLIEFAKAFQEKLMEEAVEGDYDCQYMAPAVFLDKYLDGVKDGDKVRVIIVKE